MARSRVARGFVSSAALLLLFMLFVCSSAAGISSARLGDSQPRPNVQSFKTSSDSSKCCQRPYVTPPFLRQSDVLAVRLGRSYTDCLFQTATVEPDFLFRPRTPGVPHGRISIQDDSDFANQALAEGWPGNGTAVSPYVIEGFDFNCTGTGVPCIEISHTAVYFAIRDCTMLGGTYSVISLHEVSNGYLFNNTCMSQGTGIGVFNSTLITVANCNCSSRGPDIGVSYSTQVTLFDNTCYGDPTYADWSNIYLVESTQNKVINNTCFSPIDNIELYIAGNNTIANNTLYGGGFRFREFGALAEHRQALVTGNTVNGKPLVFWQDWVGDALPSSFGQAILVNCSQARIQDTTVSGCGAGIVLVYCNETTLVSVRCEYSKEGLILYAGGYNMVLTCQFVDNYWNGAGIGASIVNSSYNVFADNTFLYNAYGILLAGSHNALLNNTFMESSTCGIIAESASYNTINMSWIVDNTYGLYFSLSNSGGNLIQDNVFRNPMMNVGDGSSSYNTYDLNYWSDYYGPDDNQDGVGDVAYYIAGTSNNWDWRPLMLMRGSPVTWLEVPQDQFFLYGAYIYYDLDATATPPGINQWWLNDTTLFTIDQYGVLTNLVMLGAGTYWVEVSVSDWIGNVITAGFNIVVYGWMTNDIPIFAFIIGTVAVVSTATFVSIVGIVLLRQRRTPGPPPPEPFSDTRPPVQQWNTRCPLCGSHLFGDEGFCPGCGNRVTKARSG